VKYNGKYVRLFPESDTSWTLVLVSFGANPGETFPLAGVRIGFAGREVYVKLMLNFLMKEHARTLGHTLTLTYIYKLIVFQMIRCPKNRELS